MTPEQYFNIGLPIVTLLVGIWIGHEGFKGALTQVETDISDIKNWIHPIVPAPTVVATVTPAHA